MHFSTFNKKLLIFPTSRAIREYLKNFTTTNTLLPTFLTIDEFLKKVLLFDNRHFIDEEERFLFLKEAANIEGLKKLGFSNEFSFFFKQSDYLFRFFGEMASEKVNIDTLTDFDTYEFYHEHIEILKEIYTNYVKILDKNSAVDKINMPQHYKLNENFLDKFDEIGFFFEGYLTNVELDIIKEVAQIKPFLINLHVNEYNQKSIESFKTLGFTLDDNTQYTLNLSENKIITKSPTDKNRQNINVEAFNSRTNQIAFIKKSITSMLEKGVDPAKIALVLPDENFALQLQLYDNEGYFNYAMGLDIYNEKLYKYLLTIIEYLNEDELKTVEELEFLKIDREYLDSTLKKVWHENISEIIFDETIEYLKSIETNSELLEKFDETVFRLKQLFFKTQQNLSTKEAYKILFQKVSKITLDDVSSGPITVMGLLESRAVNYDGLIIVDFNEGFIPKRSVKDKFLSTSLKKGVNLPTAQDRENLQKYYYHRIITQANEVYISYVKNETMQISRFASELFKEHKFDTNIQDDRYKHILFNRHKINHFDSDVSLEIDLSKLTWSATSLKTYLSCKRKFYLHYISAIKEHNTSLKPQGYELGDLIHKTLHKLYTQSEPRLINYEKLLETLNETKNNNAYLLLDIEVWKKRLDSFIAYEKERFKSNLNIVALEKPFMIEHKGIKLKGVIDRIDQVNKNLVVLDYKTSSSLKVDTLKNYEKTKDFQLEFYFLAAKALYQAEEIETAYYDLYETTLKEEVTLVPKLELLDKVLEELHTTQVEFNKCEEKSNCLYCEYKTICDR